MVSLVLEDIGKPSVLRPSTQALHKLGTWTDTVSFSNHKDLGNILCILAEKVLLDKPYTKFCMKLLMCPQQWIQLGTNLP